MCNVRMLIGTLLTHQSNPLGTSYSVVLQGAHGLSVPYRPIGICRIFRKHVHLCSIAYVIVIGSGHFGFPFEEFRIPSLSKALANKEGIAMFVHSSPLITQGGIFVVLSGTYL